MKTLDRSCSGLDVHKTEVVACLRLTIGGKVPYEVCLFPMTTRGLLAQAGCAQVAMEATCVYRTPVWQILEEAVEQMPANATLIKGVSGRQERRRLVDKVCSWPNSSRCRPAPIGRVEVKPPSMAAPLAKEVPRTSLFSTSDHRSERQIARIIQRLLKNAMR